MPKRMLVDALHPEEMRVVIADESQIYEFDFVTAAKKQIKGNIYLAKITRVEPSLQAAFVEYGGGKQGFLPFAEIHPDYYQIPVEDRKRLIEEAQREADEAAAHEDSEGAETGGQASDPTDDASASNWSSQAESATETTPLESVESPDEPAEPAVAGPMPAFAMRSEPLELDDVVPLESNEEATPPQAEGVESVAGGEEEEARSRPKRQFAKRYKIQEVIRRGQVVLVQVIKEERGNKGVSLTTYLSLAGRYCVLMPNSPKDGGISRKIATSEDRRRLKEVLSELQLSQGMSVIIRTAGLDRSRAEIKRDFDYLVKLWNRIREDTLSSTAPALIYQESDLIKRCIRDQYTSDIDELIIEGDEAYRSAKEFMKMLLPSHAARVKHYKESTPLFYAYNVEDQLLSMHDPVVKLKSGGYIVINPTEALISIDVNSGRATGERNIEETASKTNFEAANEIARQLRLRDLAGLIVIDFIDMMESRNRRNVERTLKDALKMDRAKIQLGRISPFGLLEMSRQRLRPSISESSTIICPHCTGRGHIRSQESLALQIFRSLEKEASAGNWSGLRLIVPEAVALHLLNAKRGGLGGIEEKHDVQIQIAIDHSLSDADFRIEKQRRTGESKRRPQRVQQQPMVSSDSVTMDDLPELPEEIEPFDLPETEGEEGADCLQRRRRTRGGRNRNRTRTRTRSDNFDTPQEETGEQPGDVSDIPSDAQEGVRPREEADRPRRNRGVRGGRRRWRDGEERGETPQAAPAAVEDDIPTSWKGGATEEISPALPAFTRQPVRAEIPQEQPMPMAVGAESYGQPVANPLTSTPRDPSAPVKKGWWKKMIELDD